MGNASFFSGFLHLLPQLLHLDVYLNEVVRTFGATSYLIFAVILFCETGLVVTPILPGDSLLFAAGAIVATGAFRLDVLLACMITGVVLGDMVNYSIGNYLGPRVWTSRFRFLKQEHLARTRVFFEKYGAKTIVMARFVPIVRTFAPFLAGVGRMRFLKFASYSVSGGVLWVLSCTLGGYFFGNIPFVRKNFSLAVLAVVLVSVLPALFEYLNHRAASKALRKEPAAGSSVVG